MTVSKNHGFKRGAKSWVLAVLLLVVLLGAAARLYKLDEKSLWSDELATIATSMGNSIDPDAYTLRNESFDPPRPIPASEYLKKATQSHGAFNWKQTANVLKANVHPPFFFALMNAWIHAFGFSADVLRVPAVLFGILCMPMMFVLALRLGRWNAHWQEADVKTFALISTALLAFSAYQIDHAQDARQYTLLVLLALGSVWQMLGVLEQCTGWWRWLALGLTLALGLYTQYFFMVFAGFVFAVLLWQGRSDKAFLTRLLLTAIFVLLLVLPWWPMFQVQMTFFKNAGHYTAGLWNPLQLLEKLWRIACEFFLPDSKLGKLAPFLILLAASGGALWQFKQASEKRLSIAPVLALILFWLVAVMGGQVLLDVLKNTHTATIRRYLLLASPACTLLLAYALVSLGRVSGCVWKGLQVGLGGLLLALMLGDAGRYLLVEHASSDEFKQAAGLINPAYQAGDTVLVSKSGAMAVGMAYYLKPEVQMMGVHVPGYQALSEGAPLSKRLAQTAGASQRVWLVYSHAANSTRFGLQTIVERQGFQLVQERKFPGVRVLLMGRQVGFR